MKKKNNELLESILVPVDSENDQFKDLINQIKLLCQIDIQLYQGICDIYNNVKLSSIFKSGKKSISITHDMDYFVDTIIPVLIRYGYKIENIKDYLNDIYDTVYVCNINGIQQYTDTNKIRSFDDFINVVLEDDIKVIYLMFIKTFSMEIIPFIRKIWSNG